MGKKLILPGDDWQPLILGVDFKTSIVGPQIETHLNVKTRDILEAADSELNYKLINDATHEFSVHQEISSIKPPD